MLSQTTPVDCRKRHFSTAELTATKPVNKVHIGKDTYFTPAKIRLNFEESLQEKLATYFSPAKIRPNSEKSLQEDLATPLTMATPLDTVMIDEKSFMSLYNKTLSEPSVEEKLGTIVHKYSSDIREDVKDLKQRMSELELKNKSLEEQNISLTERVDALEQFNKNRTLRISGCEDDPEEDPENTILEICESLSLELDNRDVEKAYKVGKFKQGSKRDILVTFVNLKIRKIFWAARTSLGENGHPDVFVNEILTNDRQYAAYVCRELKRQDHITNTWTFEGEIYASTDPTTKARPVSTVSKIGNLVGVSIPPNPRYQPPITQPVQPDEPTAPTDQPPTQIMAAGASYDQPLESTSSATESGAPAFPTSTALQQRNKPLTFRKNDTSNKSSKNRGDTKKTGQKDTRKPRNAPRTGPYQPKLVFEKSTKANLSTKTATEVGKEKSNNSTS